MEPVIFPGYVRCSFGPLENIASDEMLPSTDVFLLNVRDFGKNLGLPGSIMNSYDIEKASRLSNPDYRTFILNCYTILRLILARRLKCKPEEIIYTTLRGGKPVIKDNPVFFNISHTRTGFAFSLSENFYNGIDLEEISQEMNFIPVIKRFFGENEVKYILGDEEKSRERFYQLWTRKEALLKSIGSGIIDNLSTVEVHREVNELHRTQFACLLDNEYGNHHYIYSGRFENASWSVALPCMARIDLHAPDMSDYKNYL